LSKSQKIDELVIESLHQQESENKDGMDICLCRIDVLQKDEQGNEAVNVVFSGAKSSLFYSRDNEIHRVKGIHRAIGNFKTKETPKFEANELLLMPGDMLYLSTDGYVDQNNPERIRFGTTRFMKVLSEAQNLDLSEQKLLLDKTLSAYMGNEEQRDDIAVIGIKI